MKKVDTKQWLEAETKKVISDKKKYNRDHRYKRELDYAVLKKVLLMIPLLMIIFASNIDPTMFGEWILGNNNDISAHVNNRGMFPNVWICPEPSCGFSNYDGISSCALCGTART